METFLRERLFEPVGMHDSDPKFDDQRNLRRVVVRVRNDRDFAKFGELYRNDGVVDGRQSSAGRMA